MRRACFAMWLGVFMAWLGLADLRSASAAENRPSFVVFVTDDQRWDCLSCTGHPHLRTPHLDGLAARGTLFENAFVTTAICCVSRASLLTGQYGRRCGVGDFQTPLPPAALAQAYPVALRSAGYRTAVFGKWGLGGQPPQTAFDAWDAWGGQGEFFQVLNGERLHNSEYLTRRCIEFLRAQPADQPFCLVVLYKSPHEPYQPDPQDAELFRDTVFDLPRTATEAHFQAWPEFLRRSEGRRRFLRDCPTPEAEQEFIRQYLRCIVSVDRSVGAVLQELEAVGRTQETVVFFTSDNGFFLGEHGMSHKWFMHEESIRVPLIVADPRWPAQAGQRRSELALNVDLAPTILDLAGVAPIEGAFYDGTSLRPVLAGEAAPAWREHFFYEYHFGNAGTIPRSEGVRTAQRKYIRYVSETPPAEQLYDLEHDRWEEHDLAADPQWAGELAELRRLYEAESKRLPPAILSP